MAIYVISDLHLSFGTNKPMNIFGKKWEDYEEKIKKDWIEKVKEEDTVLLAGDFSWAMYLDESVKDFEYLNSLPGRKIMLKGNHDYWWETVSKMNEFLRKHNFKNIEFLYNNTIETDECFFCGTRYWAPEEDKDNEKIFNREIERAKRSLELAKKQNEKNVEEGKKEKPIIMVTHYPPDNLLINAVKDYNIKIWIYGHIHSNYEESKVEIEGIPSYLTSCDYMDFELLKLDFENKVE